MADDEVERDMAGRNRRLAAAIGSASLVPFVALVAIMLGLGGHGVWSAILIDAFKTWSALTLAFLGGIRWGLAMRGEPASAACYVFAVLAMATGWAALFVPDDIGIGVLLLAHCAIGAWDSLSAQRGTAPAWFGTSRIVWTLLVSAAHIVFFVATY